MFSKATEYALRATFYIAQKSTKTNKLSIDAIAGAIGSPKPFTAKILQILAGKKHIVSSVRGPNGGFYIDEQAKKLSLYSILEAMDEDTRITRCIIGLPKCSPENPCPLHHRYEGIKSQLLSVFETTTIDDITQNLGKQSLYLKYFATDEKLP